MSSEYKYDEQGQFFPVFLLVGVSCFILPMTFSTFFGRITSKKNESVSDPFTAYRPKDVLKKKEPKIRLRHFIILIGWVVIGYLSYRIAYTKLSFNVWDPYEILGIPKSMAVDDIRRHYKRLSIKFHPDKIRNMVNTTREEVEAKYIELTSAYRALTDEETRENYVLYGTPDVPQHIDIGIALPNWIADKNNSIYVLGFYGLIFGIFLPYSVGRWWYGSRTYTRDQVHVGSVDEWFPKIHENLEMEDILQLLASSKELQIFHSSPEASKKTVVELMNSHLNRKDKSNPDMQRLLSETDLVMNALVSVIAAYGFSKPTDNVFKLWQHIVQAVPLDTPLPLLQLPHLHFEDAKKLASRGITRIPQFLQSQNEKSMSCLSGYSKKQVQEMVEVASNIPRISILDAKVLVDGDDVVTTGAIANFVLRLKCSYGEEIMPEVSVDGTEVATEQDKIDAERIHMEKDEVLGDLEVLPHAWAPHFTQYHKTAWWVYVVDPRQNRVIIPPFSITDIPRTTRTIRIPFQVPPVEGTFKFQTHVVSNSYLGEDIVSNLTIIVKDAAVIQDVTVEEDEFSEAEDDSFENPKHGAESMEDDDEESDEEDDPNANGFNTDTSEDDE
ncbi:ER protein translocation subcomplex subunit Sec63 [Schizosaccharomyces cryophilus OY26]|uniref:ER protein translocation subcomplex subunit Sec63 n=1 Tax=Schizosaccharomyces cryophilus (strain OY26 / ATCC MYA-4695 / CBS 11777 / NBRC 106824 / NRRL Y48691) TaxID=653667 RepID=S9X715_SCHCR|nr:ER protein translocation subcomplex subunit Sec63 [Schizosaccharomyces cryophilus OY26]EPY52862.1 ER protein translocation subcomplex subunit Sec63 [Schizosaccharomyces cryophilus OY26]